MNELKRIWSTKIFWSAVIFLQSTLLFSADAILIRKSGIVELRSKHSNIFKKVGPGTELYFGDTIQTLKGSKAQVLFSEGNAILIKESSSLKI